MYVSPAVRSIKEDPIEGETVTLLVEAEDDADTDALASALVEAGGEVRDRRRFGTVVVTVDHDAVADVCSLAGIDVVETDKATTIDPDGAGEDVEYDGDV
ncbi:hypothetical protein GJ629_10255 [Halapricum sp. CBA1109]|uniref:hypothetical protein n=1 Tax=Halapricum sp. CBA1109 TaxID=2668068 RepID=UPI0012FA932B|nr:hypothetical protein [Halapricum sp. CBA1109]MUV90224.1 hypothetical protein [Halapricum sp. CBA1109]